MSDWINVSTRNRCPVCEHSDWCRVSRDGRAAHCYRVTDGPGVLTREDAAGRPYGHHWLVPLAPGSARPTPQAYVPPPEPERADVDTLHLVYSALLDALALTPGHRAALLSRGLPDAAVDAGGYRSLPYPSERGAVLGRLRAALAPELAARLDTVPGFLRGKLLGPVGLLIPVRDTSGRIVALKVRRDTSGPGEPRYVWLSSRRDDGSGGPGPGAPVHCPLQPESQGPSRVRVTEGPLKADVAQALSGQPTLGIPGASCTRGIIDGVRALGAEAVLLSWDADARRPPRRDEASGRVLPRWHVAAGLEAAAHLCADAGLSIALETWPVTWSDGGAADGEPSPKGIDDALAVGAVPVVHEGQGAWKELVGILRAAGKAPRGETLELAGLPTDMVAERIEPVSRPRPSAPRTREPGEDDDREPADGYALTDVGNAERLVARHGRDLRYCGARGKWLVWDGVRWAWDDSQEVDRRAIETVRALGAEASRTDDPDRRKALLSHALKSESAAKLGAMVGVARCLEGIPVAPDQLDADPWLLNVQNGTIDLRTGTLRPHAREDLCTKLAPVAFDPAAPCPTFDGFLATVQPDPEIRAFVLRLLGYALTGVIREHILPIHYGGGGNGKGTLTDTVLAILGTYGKQVPTDMLLAKNNDAHPADRATLLGTRFAAASETDEGRALAAALVKQLTGGDTISARFMRQDFFEFQPTHKLWVSTNHKPVVKDTSHAMWRRVCLIPWLITIAEGKADAGLKGKLMAEAAGILAAMVQGCLEWQRSGLQPPKAVKIATEEYRGESDWLAPFLAARCSTTPAQPGGKSPTAPAKELYLSYQAWCEAAGEEPHSQTAFGRAMSERGFGRAKTSTILRVGVRMLSREEIVAAESRDGKTVADHIPTSASGVHVYRDDPGNGPEPSNRPSEDPDWDVPGPWGKA